MAIGSDQIWRAAKAAHEANRVLCLALGDTSQPTWEDAPAWQQKSAVMGVEQINAHPDTTPEQSHEGWLKVKTEDGWKYGPVKNPETKEHPCFVPYSELPENQRLKDEMFGLVVRSVLGIAWGDGMNEAELPQYQCHKKVWGLKIACVEYLPQDMVALQFHNTSYAPIEVSVANRPKPSNDWYYVVYKDGYHSFSPAKVFEDYYTLIKPVTMDDVRAAASELHNIFDSKQEKA